MSKWWLLAADQALLRALCWLVPKPSFSPSPGSLSNCPRVLWLRICSFPGAHYLWVCCPARQGHTPPRGPRLCRGSKLLPPPASGRIRKGSEGLMKTDWLPLGRLILKRLSTTAVQRIVLICLPTAKVPMEALPAALC